MTETKTERWCVHIPGPDDLYAQPSKEAAEKLAAEHNEAMAPLMEKARSNPNYPRPESITAVVVQWPHEPVTDDEWAAMCAEDAEGDR